jgi:exopolysaccharide production protein ExoZ
MKKLYGVQYLRAAAALGVLVFHAAERSGGHFVIGAAGVDVFFVISGFIMWVISQKRPVTPLRFFGDRIRRVVPIYWMATAAMCAGALIDLFPNLTLTVGHAVGSFLFIPHRSPDGGHIWPVLVQGWTLNYEMFFYAIFALVLLLPSGRRLPVLAAIFLLLAGCGLLSDSQNPLFVTYTNPLLLEFLLGTLIGRLWLSGRMPPAKAGAGLIVLSLCGFAFVGVTLEGFSPFILGPLAALLLVGTLALEDAGAVPRSRLFSYVGDGSYSIYLWHTFAVSAVAKAAAFFGLPAPVTLVMGVLAGVFLGLLMYEWVERDLPGKLRAILRGCGAFRKQALSGPPQPARPSSPCRALLPVNGEKTDGRDGGDSPATLPISETGR